MTMKSANSTFERLTIDRCEKCHVRRELVDFNLDGDTIEICRRCATNILRRRAAR